MLKFWNNFSNEETSMKLLKVLESYFPDETSDERKVEIACICGMMAEVIHADGTVEENEVVALEAKLQELLSLDETTSKKVSQIVINHIEELAGLESHYYSNEVKDAWDREMKTNFLYLLFHIAACDGVVDSQEVEKIRLINSRLCLDHTEFIEAKISVKDKLKILG